jgi:hypothetical protein
MYIPFKWAWYQYFSTFYITDDETFEDERVTGKMLWKLLIGIAQTDMKWYWTYEEVKAKFGLLDDDVIDDVRDDEYWKGID